MHGPSRKKDKLSQVEQAKTLRVHSCSTLVVTESDYFFKYLIGEIDITEFLLCVKLNGDALCTIEFINVGHKVMKACPQYGVEG